MISDFMRVPCILKWNCGLLYNSWFKYLIGNYLIFPPRYWFRLALVTLYSLSQLTIFHSVHSLTLFKYCCWHLQYNSTCSILLNTDCIHPTHIKIIHHDIRIIHRYICRSISVQIHQSVMLFQITYAHTQISCKPPEIMYTTWYDLLDNLYDINTDFPISIRQLHIGEYRSNRLHNSASYRYRDRHKQPDLDRSNTPMLTLVIL